VVAVEIIQVAAATLGHYLAAELVILAYAYRSDRSLVALHPGAEVAGLVGGLHAELVGVAAGAGVAQGGGEGAVYPGSPDAVPPSWRDPFLARGMVFRFVFVGRRCFREVRPALIERCAGRRYQEEIPISRPRLVLLAVSSIDFKPLISSIPSWIYLLILILFISDNSDFASCQSIQPK
jgi:hypothetical protein